MARVVVVGASIAGITLAQSLRELGFDGEIVLVEAESGLPYQRPPLSKEVLLGAGAECADLIDEAGLAAIDVELLHGRAIGIDVAARVLELERERLSYDELVLANGATAAVPDSLSPLLDGGAHVLRTRSDALGLAAALARDVDLAVLGGGVLGSEIASAAAARGRPTTLLARRHQSVGPLHGTLAAPLLDLHRSHGVDVRTEPAQISGTAGDWSIRTETGQRRAGELVLAVGVRAAADWLAGALPASPDGVRCDARGQVAPGVWAVGDVADRAGGRYDVSRKTQAGAIAQARGVAAAIAGAAPPVPAVPYFWTDLHGVRVQAAGRIGPQSRAEVLERDDDGAPVTFSVLEHGMVVGAVAWGSPRGFRRARALLDTAAPAEAVAR